MKGKEGGGTRGGVEDKESSECALDPDTSRAPKFSRAIRRGIAYEPPSLHLRRPILSRHISRNPSKFRGGVAQNRSPFYAREFRFTDGITVREINPGNTTIEKPPTKR